MIQFQAHPQVTSTKIDENEYVLLHLETKVYYSVNESGELIWKHLQKLNSKSIIADSIAIEFGMKQSDPLNTSLNLSTNWYTRARSLKAVRNN